MVNIRKLINAKSREHVYESYLRKYNELVNSHKYMHSHIHYNRHLPTIYLFISKIVINFIKRFILNDF